MSIPVYRVTMNFRLTDTEMMRVSVEISAASRYDALMTGVTQVHEALTADSGSEDDFELIGVGIEAVVNGGS